jgi:hypothetical protein
VRECIVCGKPCPARSHDAEGARLGAARPPARRPAPGSSILRREKPPAPSLFLGFGGFVVSGCLLRCLAAEAKPVTEVYDSRRSGEAEIADIDRK